MLLGVGSHLLANRIEIERVKRSMGNVYLMVDPSAQVEIGDRLLLIDTENGNAFGLFEIVEKGRTRCTAQNVGNLDPIWAGELHQMGASDPIRHLTQRRFFTERDAKKNEYY